MRFHKLTRFIPVLAVLLLCGCAALSPDRHTGPQALTILHTNDHHGRFWKNADGEYGPPTNFFQAFDNGADRDHIDACADHIHRIPARRRTAGPLLQSKALKKPRKRLLSTGPVQGHAIEDIGCLFGILKVDHLFPGHQAVHQLHGTASASFLRFIQLIT